MRQLKYTAIALILMATSFWGCKSDLLTPLKATRGNAHFTRYLAIGGSESAGFADGALYRTAQLYSYPSLLAQQFALTGSISFKQPLLPNDNGVGLVNNHLQPRYVLGFFKFTPCNSAFAVVLNTVPGYFDSLFVPVLKTVLVDTTNFVVKDSGAFNNLSVPLIHTADWNDPNYSQKNIYYHRMVGDTVIAPANLIRDGLPSPTFFTVWLGMQDVLDYALAGGANTSLLGASSFKASLHTILDSLTKDSTTGGVLANLPDVTDLPYFNGLTYNNLTLNTTLANLLNNIYADRNFNFQPGNNKFIVSDPSAQGGLRQILPTEKVLLSVSLDSVKCNLYGSVVPMPDKYVLTEQEISTIQQTISAYNQAIADEAQARNLPLVDIYSLYKSLKTGVQYNGVNYTNVFVTGNFFSLDGLNPSAAGNAFIANEFIKQINNRYKSNIPSLAPSNYFGPLFP